MSVLQRIGMIAKDRFLTGKIGGPHCCCTQGRAYGDKTGMILYTLYAELRRSGPPRDDLNRGGNHREEKEIEENIGDLKELKNTHSFA